MSAEEKSLRDELNAAFEKAETPAAGTAEETKTPAVESPTSEVKKNDASTDIRPSGAGNDDGAAGKPAAVVADKSTAKDKAEPAGDKSAVVLDAPVSLKATERAEWAKAPKAIQEAFLRRDAEVQTALRQSAEARKFTEEFSQVVGPFMPMIRAQNSTPMTAFKNLMNTAAGLTVGTAAQKAQIIRDIINNYRVDIKELDRVLSEGLQDGTPSNPGPGTSDIEVHVQKAVAPIYEFMQGLTRQQQAAQERMQTEAERAVAAFKAKNEYAEQLADDIADLMELAASRGREMTMQQAYDHCVELNPTIKAAINQKKIASNNGVAERALLAASSVAGSPTGERPRDPSKFSLRDDISAAFDQAQGR